MLFNSLVFLIFAAIFFAVWPFIKRVRNLRFLFLVTASFIFYGWWDWRFLFLIIGSGMLDYVSGLGMAAQPRFRKAYLGLSILGNVGSLMLFKYSGFFADNLSGDGVHPLAHFRPAMVNDHLVSCGNGYEG